MLRFGSYNFGFRLEFAVITPGNFLLFGQFLQQTDAYRPADELAFGQPHVSVHARLLENQLRSRTEPEKKQTERNGVESFGLEPDPLILGLVDPKLAANFQ